MLKQKRLRSRKHLDWLKELACYKCRNRPCDPAHIRKFADGGTSLKPSDSFAIPLCWGCHSNQHNIGELTFYGDEKQLRKAIKYANVLWNVSMKCGRVK